MHTAMLPCEPRWYNTEHTRNDVHAGCRGRCEAGGFGGSGEILERKNPEYFIVMLYFHGYTRLLCVSIRLSCTRRGNHSCIHLHQRRFSSSLQTKRRGAGGYLAYLLPSALFLSRFLLLIKDVISACQTSGWCLSRNNDSGGDVNGRRVNAPLITHA